MNMRATTGGASCSYAATPVQARLRPATSTRSSNARSRNRVRIAALLKPADGVAASWSQTTDEVMLKVPVEPSTRGRDLKVEIHPRRLSVRLAGGSPLLEGSFSEAGDINLDDSFWTVEGEGDDRHVAITLAKAAMGFESWTMLLESDRVDKTVTDRVFLRVSIDGKPAGAVVLGLYGKVVPRTVENFKQLCTGEAGIGAMGKALHFKGCAFHRIIPGFMVQGGDITEGDGTGGDSIYGEAFEDENFKIKHDAAGILSMANAGPATNNSQFFITLAPTPHLDGKHVVFGSVEAGMNVVRRLEALGSPSGQPSQRAEITECGVLPLTNDEVDQLVEYNRQLQFDAQPELEASTSQ